MTNERILIAFTSVTSAMAVMLVAYLIAHRDASVARSSSDALCDREYFAARAELELARHAAEHGDVAASHGWQREAAGTVRTALHLCRPSVVDLGVMASRLDALTGPELAAFERDFSATWSAP